MDIQSKINIVKSFAEEIITEEDLKTLYEKKEHPVAYDGFEPSGNPHIAQVVMRAININKLTSTGVKFKMLVADWHAWANNKMGGDLDKIRTVGNYLIEMWKAAGMDASKIEFVWANDMMGDPEYWKKVMKIASASTLQRIIRCSQIMGRKESDTLSASQIFYPCMQCADIFHLGVDIAQLGMDQRKVNMLAREVGDKIFGYKPVAVHHHMLMGLSKPPSTDLTGVDRVIELKMSKSKPETAIFMTDSQEDIKKKINNAYCPDKAEEDNPLLEYCKYIIMEKTDKFKVERPAKFGGDVEFNNYAELRDAYVAGKLHPMDLKTGIANELEKIVKPIRTHFQTNNKAKELFETVQSYKVTR